MCYSSNINGQNKAYSCKNISYICNIRSYSWWFGIYDKLIEIGGAGATIPLPSFGNSLADAAIKGVKEDGLLGAFIGGIKGAAGGITAAIFFGYLMALIFNPKTKK